MLFELGLNLLHYLFPSVVVLGSASSQSALHKLFKFVEKVTLIPSWEIGDVVADYSLLALATQTSTLTTTSTSTSTLPNFLHPSLVAYDVERSPPFELTHALIIPSAATTRSSPPGSSPAVSPGSTARHSRGGLPRSRPSAC